MLRTHRAFCAITFFFLLVFPAQRTFAQQDYGNRLGHSEAREVEFRPRGPWMDMGSVDPAMRKWYLSQELYQEYRWQTWEYTNYGENLYQRYVDPFQQGDYFYDLYGNFLTRGWLVYDWTEERPHASEGSRLLKRGEYGSFFSNLIISADQKGQYAYSITIGNEIFTTLTPLTFRKAVFNGTQVDFRSDDVSVTGLFSRISAPGFIADPNAATSNNFTNLLGGRATVRLGDRVTVGGTFVNSHTGRTTQESFTGNPFKGALTPRQLEEQINLIVIRLSDDSPADGKGGAVLLAQDVEITTMIGDRDTVLTGSEINGVLAQKYRALNADPPPFPGREGGLLREGVLVADGNEQVELRYDLNLVAEAVDDQDLLNNISGVRFRLVLVNDYKIEVTSNSQTNAAAQPIFLVVTQAEGNIKDGSNKTEVVFDYGIPTANQVFGFTVEVDDLMGFNLYTELDMNHQFKQYPNQRRETLRSSSGIAGDESATAWMINLSRFSYPWYFFAEGFYMEEDYNTSPFMVDGFGKIDYSDPTTNVYDFVDDNDDQDRKPDQQRLFQDPRSGRERGNAGRSGAGFGDEAVFPGWDENNDSVSDFNQNDNLFRPNSFPDYDEPFMRYHSDRPEFLFGTDLNNNGWIDRFENDDEPDYPYKRDHKGYNIYLGGHITPHGRLTIGQVRQLLLADDRRNLTTYGLFAFDKDYAGIGRLRLANMLKKARDNIQDDLSQWVQTPGASGSNQFIVDPLFAEDTWLNTAFAGFERRSDSGLNFANKFKYEIVRQRRDESGLNFKKNTRLLGLINKVDYLHQIGSLTIRPKFKSELLKDNTLYSTTGSERDAWSGIFFLIFKFPLLEKTTMEVGLEQMFHQDRILEEKPLLRDDQGNLLLDEEGNTTGNLDKGDLTGDLRNTVVGTQLSNTGDYMGYQLIAQLGVSIERSSLERFGTDRQSQIRSLVYATLYAGLRD